MLRFVIKILPVTRETQEVCLLLCILAEMAAVFVSCDTLAELFHCSEHQARPRKKGDHSLSQSWL